MRGKGQPWKCFPTHDMIQIDSQGFTDYSYLERIAICVLEGGLTEREAMQIAGLEGRARAYQAMGMGESSHPKLSPAARVEHGFAGQRVRRQIQVASRITTSATTQVVGAVTRAVAESLRTPLTITNAPNVTTSAAPRESTRTAEPSR